MPYAGDVYSLPPGTSATSNTTILSAMFNAFVADIAAAQNAARPIAVGGTGAATVGAAFDNLHTASSNIASATTTDLSTATGYYVQVTGTTTITGFGTEVAGVPRFLRFAGILTLTHNATSLILPTGASITTAAGDTAIVVSEGSGNWRCLAYQRASGAALAGSSAASTTEVLTGTDTAKAVTPDALAALWEKGSNVASATTISLGEGGLFHITGTTTITDIDFATPKDGRMAWLEFDGALTLTHNATTLVLPGGANITTAAGDRARIVQDSNDNVHVLAYTRINGGLTTTAGAAPAFAVRASINFDGTGTPSIRGSNNVSSLTDNGVGDYTMNLATALPNGNYAASVLCDNSVTSAPVVAISASAWPTASAFRMKIANNTGTAIDTPYITAIIVG